MLGIVFSYDMQSVIILDVVFSIVILSDIMLYRVLHSKAECQCTECCIFYYYTALLYDECRVFYCYAKCHCAECRLLHCYTECCVWYCYTECHCTE
jgi:hypothetical protein